jgi:hypothetical protein
MRNYFYVKMVVAVVICLMIALKSNSYSIELRQNQVNIPAENSASKLCAISTDNSIVIDYRVTKTENSYLIVTDIFGNKLKVIKLSDLKGKVNIKLSELMNAGGSGTYKCSIQVDGALVITQPVAMLNS